MIDIMKLADSILMLLIGLPENGVYFVFLNSSVHDVIYFT